MKYGLENAIEAGFFWVDEGVHMDTLERMQATQSLKLIHPAYTAFYLNLSYVGAWLINGGEHPIPSKAFGVGSRWTSLISMNLQLLVVLALGYYAFSSFKWALLLMGVVAGQRFHILFATRMHPEALMLLFTALTVYCGSRLLAKGQPKYLWGMAASAGFAIGTKLQVVFLVPWGGLMLGLMLWKSPKVVWKSVAGWVLVSGVAFTLAFFVASPYQLIHLPELIQGMLSQSSWIVDYYPDRSLWRWFDILTSELVLGDVFSLLFAVALIFGLGRLVGEWKQHGKAILDRPAEALFVANLLWMVVGVGYIVTTYYVFAHRYLIHVYFSFLTVIVLGLYWWAQAQRPFYHWGVKVLIGLLIVGGIHTQWRHSMRDADHRQKIHSTLAAHREFAKDLPRHVPYDAWVAHTIRVYISHHLYPQAFTLFSNVRALVLDQDIDYLLVNKNYRPAMRTTIAMRGTDAENQRTINFWDSLEQDGVGGLFEVVAHYPKIEVTIYKKVKSPAAL